MIIINHRCNTIGKLKKTPTKYGIEVDIRTFGNKIIVHHDPFINGESFSKWIKYYSHKFLILNVKEEGLEKKLLKIMRLNKIENFFLLDQSFPFLIKTLVKNEKRCALRVSDFESFETALKLKIKPHWIWLDCFVQLPLIVKKLKILKRQSYKICIVSPELHSMSRVKEVSQIIKKIKKIKFYFDAVCTKKPLLWNELSNTI